MALPKINSEPSYKCKIPSTDKTISYRPYLVKEEKVLMIAYESQNTESIITAMVDTINACVKEDLDVSRLTTFDIEYMFTQIRSKSVGEKSDVRIKCKSCDHPNDVQIDLSQIHMEMPNVSNDVEIPGGYTVVMKYPSFVDAAAVGETATISDALSILGKCIDGIKTDDEYFNLADESPQEVERFIESLTASQVAEMMKFLETVPTLQHDLEFKCEKCGEDNEVQLKGLGDFF